MSRMCDPAFTRAVEGLCVPAMGTDVVAPLLALLTRFRRPQRVLEVGMGYTTPFLAAALADLRDEGRAASVALAAKTRPYLSADRPLDETWLRSDPALLDPGYYARPYEPRLVAVDNLSIPESSAGRVCEVLTALGLDDLVTVVDADLRDARTLLPEGFAPIDLAWVDAWECLYFFDHYWDLIDPDGGLVVMHYLMTYPQGEAVLGYLDRMQRSRPGELEILNLLEPHKVEQNSLTVLRRTSGGRPEPYVGRDGAPLFAGRLRDGARSHLQKEDR